MSLVNDMLNDLEKRRTKSPAGSAAQLQWLSSHSSDKKNRWLLWLSLALLLVALVWIAMIYRADVGLAKAQAIIDDTGVKAPQLNSDNISSRSAEAVAADLVLSKPKLQLISTQKIGDQIKLLLQLDRVPGYQLQNNGDSLLIRLIDVQAHLPEQLGGLLKPVETINVRRSGNDLLVHVVLAEPVQSRASLKIQPSVQIEIMLSVESHSTGVISRLSQPVVAVVNTSATIDAKAVLKTSSPKVVTKPSSSLKTRLPLTLPQQDKRAAKEARNRMQLGQLEEAEQLLIAVLSIYPSAPESNQLLLAMLLDQQRLEQAEKQLQLLAKDKPLSLELVQLNARLLLLQHKPGHAVELLQSRRPMMQLNPEYYELLALSSQRDRQYALSEQVYKALLTMDAAKGDWWVGLAIAQELQGQKADARQHYRRAIQASRTSDALRQYAQQRYQALAGMNNIDSKEREN